MTSINLSGRDGGGRLARSGPALVLPRAIGLVSLVSLMSMAGCQAALGPTAPEPVSPYAQQYIDQFNAIDTAHKGIITLDQASAYYSAKFAELDRNHDRLLDADELAALGPIMNSHSGADLVSALDRNGDNRITEQEFMVVTNWLFQRGDGSNDLTIDQARTGTFRAPPGTKAREIPTDRLPGNR